MFAANPVDPSRVIAISFSEPSGPAVPYPRRAGRARPLAVTLLATGALAFAAAAMGNGNAVSSPTGNPTMGKAGAPVPGEFRLGPGNNQPPGIVVKLPTAAGPVPGEFRLGPGNNQPPGIVAGG